MINAGKEFRHGFLELLDTFGGTVFLIKDFNCSNSSQKEVKAMKNSQKGDILFQFSEREDIEVGDVIQQKGSSEFWKVFKNEEHITSDILVSFNVFVNRINSQGNRI